MTEPWRTGRVVDAAGHAVAEAFVSVVSGTAAFPEIALVTELDGSFRVRLPAGRFRLRADTADGRTGEADFSSESGGEILIRVSR